MLKKMVLAVATLSALAGVCVATPAFAGPHVVCHRIFVHGHPARSCHRVGPPPPPHHRPGY